MASPTRVPAGERVVERLDETARGLDEHAVAHGHDGGHANLQQLGGDGLGRLLGLRGLAGFEEDKRDAVIAQQRPKLAGEDGLVTALVELADVLRVLEAQPAEADRAVIDAVAIEVDDVIRLAVAAGAIELVAQGGQRGRAEHVDADEAAEVFHRLDQRQRAGAVINVAAGVVLRPRGDEQDADGCGDDWHVEHGVFGRRRRTRVGFAPWNRKPSPSWRSSHGRPSRSVAASRAVFTSASGAPASSATSTWTENRRPAWPSIRAQAFMTFAVWAPGRAAVVQELSPFHEALLDLPRAVPEILARPDGVFFQIPAQLLRLDRSDRRDEAPALRAVTCGCPGVAGS